MIPLSNPAIRTEKKIISRSWISYPGPSASRTSSVPALSACCPLIRGKSRHSSEIVWNRREICSASWELVAVPAPSSTYHTRIVSFHPLFSSDAYRSEKKKRRPERGSLSTAVSHVRIESWNPPTGKSTMAASLFPPGHPDILLRLWSPPGANFIQDTDLPKNCHRLFPILFPFLNSPDLWGGECTIFEEGIVLRRW